MLRTLALLLGLVVMLAACGRGNPETTGEDVDAVKAVLAGLIEARLADDLDAARPNLDVGQYLAEMDSPLAFEKNLTPEQLEEETNSCFAQLLAIKKNAKLANRSDIDGALRGARVDFLPQTRSAIVKFQAPDSTRDGIIKFEVRFTQSPGGVWKMIKVEIQF